MDYELDVWRMTVSRRCDGEREEGRCKGGEVSSVERRKSRSVTDGADDEGCGARTREAVSVTAVCEE